MGAAWAIVSPIESTLVGYSLFALRIIVTPNAINRVRKAL